MQGRKYHNIKTEYNGVMYDSKKEAKRQYVLDMMARAGIIRNLERQKRFVLQGSFVNNKGEKIREICYLADFYYWDNERNTQVVEDVKSPATRTDVYKIKKKMFEKLYPEILFEEV